MHTDSVLKEFIHRLRSPASGYALGRNQRSAEGCLSFDRRCYV
jgi:hypothetical protein